MRMFDERRRRNLPNIIVVTNLIFFKAKIKCEDASNGRKDISSRLTPYKQEYC